MILMGIMVTLLVLGGLNLLFVMAMVQGPVLNQKEDAVVKTFAIQAAIFLMIGFTIMATLAATGQMPN
jgi:hypothetical protein